MHISVPLYELETKLPLFGFIEFWPNINDLFQNHSSKSGNKSESTNSYWMHIICENHKFEKTVKNGSFQIKAKI